MKYILYDTGTFDHTIMCDPSCLDTVLTHLKSRQYELLVPVQNVWVEDNNFVAETAEITHKLNRFKEFKYIVYDDKIMLFNIWYAHDEVVRDFHLENIRGAGFVARGEHTFECYGQSQGLKIGMNNKDNSILRNAFKTD